MQFLTLRHEANTFLLSESTLGSVEIVQHISARQHAIWHVHYIYWLGRTTWNVCKQWKKDLKKNNMRNTTSVRYTGSSKSFDLAGRLPQNWISKAEEIDRAAKILFDTVRRDFNVLCERSQMNANPNANIKPTFPFLLDVFIFLAALSIENLLKGILLCGNPELISGGKLKEKSLITSHKLSKLSKDSGIDFTEDELEFMEVGTSAIHSWGRYPIPKNYCQLESSRTIKLDIGEVYNELFTKLLSKLKEMSFH
ncbi:MAG: hypothetical protein ABSF91_12805 [Bacteroidota bacterium]